MHARKKVLRLKPIKYRGGGQKLESPEHSTQRQGHFRFFDLPYKLRHQIYEEHLVLHNRYVDFPPASEVSHKPVLGVNLLRTCRHIHEEAIEVLYIGNVFQLRPFSLPVATNSTKALSKMGVANRTRIRSVEFILFPPQLLSMMQFTADPGVKGEEIAPLRTLFPNLTTFTFVVSRSFSAGLGEQHVVGFLKSYVEEAPHAKRVLWDTSGQADISRALGKIYSNGYELTTSRFTSRDRLAKPKEDNTFKSYSSKQEMNDDDAWEDLDSDDEPIQHREDHDDVWEDLDSDDEPIQHRRHKTRRGWKQRNNRLGASTPQASTTTQVRKRSWIAC